MAGGLTISTLNDSSGVLASQNGMSGIAKAWVNFNGSNGAINTSFNISSVTRNGGGDYTVNFTTAMPSAYYAISGTCLPTTGQTGSSYGRAIVPRYDSVPTTSSFRFWTVTTGVGPEDFAQVMVAVNR
jgi:hypothetical protein